MPSCSSYYSFTFRLLFAISVSLLLSGTTDSGSSWSVCCAFSPAIIKYSPALQRTTRATTSLWVVSKNKKDRVVGAVGNIGKVLKFATKAVLPKRWFRSQEEKQSYFQKTALRKDITGNLTTILDDAPSLVRVVGKVLIPMIANLAITATKQLEAQNQTVTSVIQEKLEFAKRKFQEQVEDEQRKKQWVEHLLDEAKALLLTDPIARAALGESIVKVEVSNIVSNTAIIDGKTNTFVPIFAFFVVGSKDQGFVSLKATHNGITSMSLTMTNAETIPINPSMTASARKVHQEMLALNKTRRDPDDYIDIELIGPN